MVVAEEEDGCSADPLLLVVVETPRACSRLALPLPSSISASICAADSSSGGIPALWTMSAAAGGRRIPDESTRAAASSRREGIGAGWLSGDGIAVERFVTMRSPAALNASSAATAAATSSVVAAAEESALSLLCDGGLLLLLCGSIGTDPLAGEERPPSPLPLAFVLLFEDDRLELWCWPASGQRGADLDRVESRGTLNGRPTTTDARVSEPAGGGTTRYVSAMPPPPPLTLVPAPAKEPARASPLPVEWLLCAVFELPLPLPCSPPPE